MVRPDYYTKFKCLGGECRNNCCRGAWGIEIDDDSLSRFSALEGEIGERVRTAITEENEFARVGGKCPLLGDDGLCDMVKNGCELCVVCDEYPRFTEYFGDYAERGISVSCEEAARIVLNDDSRFALTDDGEDGELPDTESFRELYAAREEIIRILQDRERDIWERLRRVFNYGRNVQASLYGGGGDCRPLEHGGRVSLGKYADLLGEMEILQPEWEEMLSRLSVREAMCPEHRPDELRCERLAIYFIYRYFLRAADDCNVVTWLKFAILGVVTVTALENIFGDFESCARRYSIEIEHDLDNFDRIFDELIFDEEFSETAIFNMIG